MPELKPFIATNTFRTDDSGYSAYATFARRAGAQYEQAGNDYRDIGRAKAATINMLGRWPFNILELQKRETERYFKGVRGSATPGGASAPRGVNVASRGSSGADYGGTTGLYPQMRMPNLAALNEMSEGAGQFGRMMGGGSQLPYEAEKNRQYYQQLQREQDRKLRLAQDEWSKRWDLYEKDLAKDNDAVMKETQKWYDSQATNDEGVSQGAEYGGTSDRTVTTQTNSYGQTVTVPDYQPDTSGGDYGGSGTAQDGSGDVRHLR